MADRYQRQIPIIGAGGQRKLRYSTAAVIGLGGLGCNVITHLASAGVGKFVLADNSTIDATNLNRQFAYSQKDVGALKTERAAEWIKRIDPKADVTEVCADMNEDNVSLLGKCDLIIDCLDNRRSRLAVNRYAYVNKINTVHGGVESLYGQVTVMIPGATPCLECILPEGGTDSVAAISPMVGIIGSIQALEAVKLLSGKGSSLSGKLLHIDASDNSYRVLDIKKRDGCGCCSAKI